MLTKKNEISHSHSVLMQNRSSFMSNQHFFRKKVSFKHFFEFYSNIFNPSSLGEGECLSFFLFSKILSKIIVVEGLLTKLLKVIQLLKVVKFTINLRKIKMSKIKYLVDRSWQESVQQLDNF